MKPATHGVIAVLAAFSLGLPAVAQRQSPPPPAEPAERAPDVQADRMPPDAARLRAFIERRLERAKSQTAMLEQVLARLDEGADLDDLREDFRELWTDRDMRDDDGDRSVGRPGPGPGDGGGPPSGREGRPGASIEREPFLEFLRVEFPMVHERVVESLKAMPADDPAANDPGEWPRVRPFIELMRLREHDPQMFGLRKSLWSEEWRSRELARQIAASPEGEREPLVAELRVTLEKQFDLQLALHRLDLERLEARLQNARREADEREAARRDTVNARLVEVLTEPDSRRRDRDRGRVRPESARNPEGGDRSP